MAVHRSASPTSILLLERDLNTRIVLTDVLTGEGYRVYACASLEELRRYQRNGRNERGAVSLALVDSWGQSHQVLHEAERQEIAALAGEIPTIMVTEREWAAITRPAELGLLGLLPKPFDLDELLGLLESSIEQLSVASIQARTRARELRGRVNRAHEAMHSAARRLTDAASRARGGHRAAPSSRRHLRMLQALLALDVTSLEAAMQRAAHDLADALVADKVDVFVHDADRDELVAIGTSDTPMGRRQHELGLDRIPLAAGGRAVQVFQAGHGALIRFSDQDLDELPAVVRDLGVRSTVAVPIDAAVERHGVLLAASGTPDYFVDDDLELLETVARWLGLVGDRIALVERRTAEAGHRAGGALAVTALTPRQREIAALIAQGLSNAEIAARLMLAPGTAANHVAQIMRRLGMRKRTQIATWVVRDGLDGRTSRGDR